MEEEKQYVEFKHDNYRPDMIGADISALANGAALLEKRNAYMLWGVDDETHEIVGTTHNLQNLKQGSQELENWLRSMLSANADFEYKMVTIDGKTVGVLNITAAASQTVTFQKTDYIRIGSYTKKLRNYPAIQAKLWDKLHSTKFEERLAMQNLTMAEALQKLNVSIYFDLIGLSQPEDAKGVVHYLLEDEILHQQDDGRLAITNLGAILFAKRLTEFSRLSRKAVRIVVYRGSNRLEMDREETILQGYAVSFENIINYIEAVLPSREIIDGAFRKTLRTYPTLAIREAVGNALIHQDFSITGMGPIVEIFPARMEITNPGTVLVDIQRIIDNPPKSRNEKMASLMRRMHICEELGTGWDKIVLTSEAAHLPAPKIDLYDESTKVTLLAKMAFNDLPMEDRLRACYLHACIQQAQQGQLTNHSLRERFALGDGASASISRLIKESVRKKLIKPLDPNTAPRYMKYIPFWA